MRRFEEYVKGKIVRKRTPDLNRAAYLKKEALNREKFISELLKIKQLTDENANYFIEMCYNVIMELIRSKMLEKGLMASGDYSHEAEVAFLSVLGFSEEKVILADEVRKARNGILYYGRIFDKEFALKVLELMREVVERFG